MCDAKNKCSWTVLSSWWPFLALRKSQNALKMGCFATKNGSKMGQKRIFPNLILYHLGCTNGCNESILSPFWGILAPQKSQKKGLKVGLVVKGITCKLISLCQGPSMCESFLMSLTSHI